MNLIIYLTIGIVLLKILWIYTEIKFFKERVNFEMYRTNFIEALILAVQILQVVYYPLPRTMFDWIITPVGIIMYLLGFILALWARYTMNRVWGIPGVDSANQNKLITKGPFSFTRNPIYLGFLLIYFGFGIAIRSPLVLLRIPLLIYFVKSAKAEEKILEKKFGKKYLSYKRNVPRFL